MNKAALVFIVMLVAITTQQSLASHDDDKSKIQKEAASLMAYPQ